MKQIPEVSLYLSKAHQRLEIDTRHIHKTCTRILRRNKGPLGQVLNKLIVLHSVRQLSRRVYLE